MQGPHGSRSGARVGRWRPLDWVSFGYMTALSVAILVRSAGIPEFGGHLAVHALSAALTPLFVSLEARFPSRLTRFARDWYPLATIAIAYFESGPLVPLIGGADLDDELLGLDRLLFGAHPAEYITEWQTPILTDVFRAFWMSYFILPWLVLVPLYLRKDKSAFRAAGLAIGLGLFSSYVGYYLVPALGPGYFPEKVGRTVAAMGTPVDRVLDVVYAAEGDVRNTFPSGHAIVALLTGWVAFKFRVNGIRLLSATIATGLCLATLYLRYHYAVDIIAGAVIALLIARLVPFWQRQAEA